MSETTRRQNNAARVLVYLQAHGAATNAELIEIGGIRYGGRLFELRRQGHDIRTEPLHGGLVRYTYHGYVQPGQMSLLAGVA